jgi:hypothetical protein
LNQTFAITDIRIASAKSTPHPKKKKKKKKKKKPSKAHGNNSKFSPKDRLNQSLASAVKPEDFYKRRHTK